MLMLVTVMTLGEDSANESGNVNWGGFSAAGCDFLKFQFFKIRK